MSRICESMLAALLLVGASGDAQAEWRVWTITDTRHVLRSDSPRRGREVEVLAARNEWVSFQILLRSDVPVRGIGVAAGELRGPDLAVLGTADVRLYRQHQLLLQVGTCRNEAFKPDGYPDPLIPFECPRAGEVSEDARFRAVPFDLPARQTYGFWVDLYVPAGTVPGKYRGTYLVTAAGEKTVEIPVRLKVWNFTLPPTPTLVTAFGSPIRGLRDYYRRQARAGRGPEPKDWNVVEEQCAQLMSEHRLNAVPPAAALQPRRQADGSFQVPAAQVQALREFVDRYHVNALQTPHPSSVVEDPEEQRETLRAWLAAFDRAARELDRPGVVFYTYLRDEPNTERDYRYVQEWGRAIRAAKSVVKVLVVEQTWTEPGQVGADSAWGDLYGAVDIWCPLFSLHRQDSEVRRRALGESIWTYTALCQGRPTPWWHIDSPLLNYRVPAWTAWGERVTGLLYWGGLSYWRETDDPWVRAPGCTVHDRSQPGSTARAYNGEGSLVYPARDVGYHGIVPTLRLKALRDAIEDYEYLAMLQRMGRTAQADKIARSLTDSWFKWEKDPTDYDRARTKLAALIVAAEKSAADRHR